MTAADEQLLLDTPAARPCPHPRVNHQHGTPAAYHSDRCRCRPCVEANSAYTKHRNREIAYGRWNAWMDAGPVREHVRQLMGDGLTWRAIAERAHLSHSTVKQLLYGRPSKGEPPSVRVRRKTWTSLLGVTGPHQPPGEQQPHLLP